MAYSKKKKRYKLNKGKKVRKAQDGLTDVVDAVTDFAGNFGGGEGIPLEDVWSGVVDTVTNLNLGNINLPSIGGSGGSRGGVSEGGSSDKAPSSKTNKPSFFNRGYANLSTDELRDAYGKHYDFGRMVDMIDHEKNPSANRFKTGRHHKWSQLFHTPENVNFDYTDGKGRKVGAATNTHPANLSAILMDVAQKDPEAIKWLMTNSHQYAPRKAGTNLNKKYNLERGAISSKDRRFMKGIDEDQVKREYEKLDLMKQGKRYGKYRGHAYDVDMMNQLLGPYLPKGFNDGKGIDSQIADLMHDAVDNKMWTDAMASMHPDIFDPGVVGVDDKGRFGAYQTRRNPGEGMDQFINAPLNYQYNMEASGLDPNRKPSQDWLRVQYMSNQGAKDGVGGYNKDQIAQMLMQDEEFLAKHNLNRGELRDSGLGYKQTTGDLYRFGVTWDDKNKKWYSEGTKDWLTPEQAEKWTSAIANKYIDESGWQQYNPTSELDPVNIGTVPSNKIDEKISKPTGPLSFNEADSDVGDDINEIQDGSVEVGTITGGYELDSEGNRVRVPSARSRAASGGSRQKKSMDAILDSVTSGTHVTTGEDYNEADLKRDAAIIKREFGNDAYDDLMNQLMSVDTVEPGSEQSVIDERETGDRDRDRGVSLNKINLVADQIEEEEDDDELSYSEQVRQMAYGDDNEDDEEEEEELEDQEEGADYSGASSGFTGDSGTGGKYSGGDPYSFFPKMMSAEEMQRMMALGETPTYKHGGFGKNFSMDKMRFNKGGKTYASDVAGHFAPRGRGGISGQFKLPTFYESNREMDPIKGGEVYLNAKILRLDSELGKLDPNDPANKEAIAALQQEILDSQAELAAVKQGIGTTKNMPPA